MIWLWIAVFAVAVFLGYGFLNKCLADARYKKKYFSAPPNTLRRGEKPW